MKYSTSKLTGVQNYKPQLVPIGLVNLGRFIACGLVNTVHLILPSLNVRVERLNSKQNRICSARIV